MSESIKIEPERMSEEFIKYHLRGMPFDVVIHHFTGRDVGSPHCHPFSFTSVILAGGYVEKVYRVGDGGEWETEIIERLPNTVHTVEATHIHEIIELPMGECWTLIKPEPKVRESRFWKFDETGSQSRVWSEGDFV